MHQQCPDVTSIRNYATLPECAPHCIAFMSDTIGCQRKRYATAAM